MKLDFILAVPSYGRHQAIAAKSRFCTANYIREVQNQTVYYVEREQLKEYKHVLPNVSIEVPRPDRPKMWGSIMDSIIDENVKRARHLIIMDDDLALAVRPKLRTKPTFFTPMTSSRFAMMLEELVELTTSNTPLTSAQYRQFCQGKTARYQHNQRISMIWCLNCKFFKDNPQYRFYRPSKLDFMTDYYFFLKLLVDGHRNLCINRYTKDDKPNAPGGEQAKRTMEKLNTSATNLAKMFPEFVKTYVKQGKGSWKDGMLGVRIHASRAFNSNAKG